MACPHNKRLPPAAYHSLTACVAFVTTSGMFHISASPTPSRSRNQNATRKGSRSSAESISPKYTYFAVGYSECSHNHAEASSSSPVLIKVSGSGYMLRKATAVLPTRSDIPEGSDFPFSFAAVTLTSHTSPSRTSPMVYDVHPASSVSSIMREPFAAWNINEVAVGFGLHSTIASYP